MFSIRVYGILMTEQKDVLVSDEYIRGGFYTKFPGGGLELGEGTRDCLQREFMEELNMSITVGDHLYTTDFYQQSAFHPAYQIISIYYHVHANMPLVVDFKARPFDFLPEQISDPKGEAEVFRLIPWHEFNAETVSLPIDKVVANLLKEKF